MSKTYCRKRNLFILLFTVSGLLFIAACAPQDNEPKPPAIAYGRDTCDACGMIISEPRFAAAILTMDGKTLKFDDAGEMFSYSGRHPELKVRVWFVHDYNSQNWISGQTAFYLMASGVKSPMGTGIAAFADKASAEASANRLGVQVLTFDEVRSAKPLMGMKGK